MFVRYTGKALNRDHFELGTMMQIVRRRHNTMGYDVDRDVVTYDPYIYTETRHEYPGEHITVDRDQLKVYQPFPNDARWTIAPGTALPVSD